MNIAIDEVLDGKPDLVVSGINKGLNVGDDVTYSGTVAGALEGALLGYQAIAVSLQFTRGEWDFEPAAALAASLAARVARAAAAAADVSQRQRAAGHDRRASRVTVQAQAQPHHEGRPRLDPRERPYFWIEEAQDDWEPRRSVGSAGDPGRLRLGDAAAAGSDRSRRAGARRRRSARPQADGGAAGKIGRLSGRGSAW